MQIEIVTTKKKLTASLVMQMPVMSYHDANYIVSTQASILGYVTIKNKNYAICKNCVDYIRLDISSDWYQGKDKFAMFNNSHYEFPSEDIKNEWLDNFKQIKRQAKYEHIYL